MSENRISPGPPPDLRKLAVVEGSIRTGSHDDASVQKAKRRAEVEEKGWTSRNKGGGVKNDAMKPRMSLIPQLAKLEVGKVMTYGAEKYSAFNWMDGFPYTIIADAIDRHYPAYLCGEDLDPESGIHHLAHLACSAMMALEICLLYPELDDRWEGWQTERGKAALKKALEPYKPSEYLKNALAKKKAAEEMVKVED